MPADTLRQRVRAAIADALNLDVAALPDPATIDTVDAWDSLGHFQVLETIAERFAVSILHEEAVCLLSDELFVEAVKRRHTD